MDHPATELSPVPPGTDDYVAYARHGSADCLERALLACAQTAYSQARRILGNAADAEDAVQETFLQLARTAHRYDGQVPFPAWVGRLVRDACMRVRRSDQRRRQRERIAMSGAPIAHHDQDLELSSDLRLALARLSEADRAVIELHYFAGLSQAHTAAALKTSENAVSLRLSRARKHLRNVLTTKGVAISAATIASILATQSAHAATPTVLAGASTLAASVAAGASLPVTFIPLSLAQKGFLFMSLHPIASGMCAALIALLCSLPLLSWAGEAPQPGVVLVDPAPAPPTAGQPWSGTARELLPFLDPQATYSVALDWEYLLRKGAATKPTSLLVDPRAAPALAHIREQMRLWAAANDEIPDMAAILSSADGCVTSIVQRSEKTETRSKALPLFIASVSGSAAQDIKHRIDAVNARTQNPGKNHHISDFTGIQWPNNHGSALFSGKKVFFGDATLLQEGLTRSAKHFTPMKLTAPAWCAFNFATFVREAAQEHSDPLDMALWLGPDWRTSTPQCSVTLAPGSPGWRSTVSITGIADLPLRCPSSAIAGCIPSGALASLLLGIDVPRAGSFAEKLLSQLLGHKTAQRFASFLSDVGLNPEMLRTSLTGDCACIVQPQAPIPAITLILGVTPAVTADLLSPAMDALGLTSQAPPTNARAAWNGVLPFGMIQVLLAHDRLVISSGDGEPYLQKRAPAIVNDEVTFDLDVPSLARLYLPLLYAQMPQKPVFFSGTPLWNWLFYLLHSQPNVREMPLPINMDQDRGFEMQQKYWSKLAASSTLTMNQCLAIYAHVDQGKNIIGQMKFIYRLADGWRLRGDSMSNLINATNVDKKAMGRELEGLVLIAGTPYEALAPLPIGKQPTFDRQWLPALAAVMEHLPVQHLSLRRVSGGVTLQEDGTPCVGILLSSLPIALNFTSGADAVAAAIQERDGEKMRLAHATALTALYKAVTHFQRRSSQEPAYLTVGDMLADAGVDLADLASLNGGKPPTTASVGSLGFWHPHTWPHDHCEWLVPIGNGWFMEMAWWAGIGTQHQGVQLTTMPKIEQRQWSEKEINDVLRNHKQSASVDAPAPVDTSVPKPQGTSDF